MAGLVVLLPIVGRGALLAGLGFAGAAAALGLVLGRTDFAVFSGLAAAATAAKHVGSRRLLRRAQRVIGAARVEDGRIVFGRAVRARPGRLVFESTSRSGGGSRSGGRFVAAGEPLGPVESLEARDFPAEVFSAALGWSSAFGSPRRLEWLELPGFLVEDAEGRARDVAVAYLPRVRHRVELERRVLAAGGGGVSAFAQLEPGMGLRGQLVYEAAGETGARGARLELVAKTGGGVTFVLDVASLEEPGSVSFTWSPDVARDAFLLTTVPSWFGPRYVAGRLGLQAPLVAGAAWREIREARLRLVIDMRLRRDLVDEAGIRVEPAV